jgi:hypothetical protein
LTCCCWGTVSPPARSGSSWHRSAGWPRRRRWPPGYGIGAGWYQPEYDAAGIAFGSAGQRLERLDASLGIIRQLLAGIPVHHADASYRIDGLDLDVLPLPPAGRAGDRFGDLEISALGTFIVTGERRAATEDLIARRGWSGIEVETVWGMPTIFTGSPDQIRADLLARRERFGLSYLVVGEDSQPALAEIISGL